MTNVERLRQYLIKASFSSNNDKFSALECLSEIKQEKELLLEACKSAVDSFNTQDHYSGDVMCELEEAIAKATGETS